jgi:hypothetical protein
MSQGQERDDPHDEELRRVLIKAISDGFTAYACGDVKAYQERDERKTCPEAIAEAVLAALAGRLLPAGGEECTEEDRAVRKSADGAAIGNWEIAVGRHQCYGGLWPPGAERMGIGSVWRCDVCGKGWRIRGLMFGIPLWELAPPLPQVEESS